MNLPAPSDDTAKYAGIVVGAISVLFGLLHIVCDWEAAPLIPQIIFSVLTCVPMVVYTFAPKVFRPLFSDDAIWDTERPATISRMRRFLTGWFAVVIPGLLILVLLVMPVMQG